MVSALQKVVEARSVLALQLVIGLIVVIRLVVYVRVQRVGLHSGIRIYGKRERVEDVGLVLAVGSGVVCVGVNGGRVAWGWSRRGLLHLEDEIIRVRGG